MTRPRCRRCGGPLDAFCEPEQDALWVCFGVPRTESEHEAAWAQLSGDEVARLERLALEKLT